MSDETTGTPEDVIAVPAALHDVDPAKLAALKAKIAAFVSGAKAAPEVNEGDPVADEAADFEREMNTPAPIDHQQPDASPILRQPQQADPAMGANVDWAEYDLPFNLRHLYPKSTFRMTPEGPKWVATLTEFYSTERSGKNHDKEVNAPGTTNGEKMEPLNLGQYLTGMVNGPDGWKIAGVLPGSSGSAIVLLERQVFYPLPDPKPLKTADVTASEVEAPTDEELARAEAAALEFASDIGLEAPAVEEPELTVEQQNALDHADLPQPAFTKTKELDPRLEGIQERVNLEINRPYDEPTVGEQPSAMTVNEDLPAGLGGRMVDEETGERVNVIAPGIENVRRGLADLLDGPDFGTV